MANAEEIQYRAPFEQFLPETQTTQDENHFSTLHSVYKHLKESMADLDRWHAFDLGKDNILTIEQQILAHRKAYEILAPALEAVESAIELIDSKFRER